MPADLKRVLWPILITLTVTSALALVIARTKATSISPELLPAGVKKYAAKQVQRVHKEGASRNLSRQPEAFNLSRRLGKRFAPDKSGRSTLVGTLTVGTEQRVIHITRTQIEEGEQVEVARVGSPVPLEWDAGQSAKAAGGQAKSDQELVERLALDSPDQFVLAQLRGASYFTIARNVRPDEAGENYDGPLWNIVRVDEPQRDEPQRPQSAWRLYYINVKTGLIDKIISEINGERIEALLSAWTEVNGEKVPGEVIWTRAGQTIMQFHLTNFSHAEQ